MIQQGRNSRQGFRVKRFVGSFTLTIAMTSGLMAVSSRPASAIAPSPSGKYGAITFNKTTGWGKTNPNRLFSGNVTAERSPGFSGTQKITVRWRVWSLKNGSQGYTWYVISQPSMTWTVYADQHVSWGGWNYYDSQTNQDQDFSTDLTVTWKTTTGGFIGQQFVDFIHLDDYVCAEPGAGTTHWNCMRQYTGPSSANRQWVISLI